MHKILEHELISILKVLIEKYANQSKKPKYAIHLLNKFFSLYDTYFHVDVNENYILHSTRPEQSIKFIVLNLSTVYIQKINLDSTNFEDESHVFFESIKELNIKNMIIDLRDNTGGNLKNALLFLSIFDADKNVQLVFTDGNSNLSQYVRQEKIDIQNIIILVNNKTISAAELIALALKQLKHTIIIGKKTFGKCEIQCNKYVLNLIVKYTIGKFLVNGIDISGKGIEPDIKIYDVCKEIDYLYEAISTSKATFVECVIFLQKGFCKLGIYESNNIGVYDLDLINIVLNYKAQNHMCQTDYITNTLIETIYSDMKKIEDKQLKKAFQLVGLSEDDLNGRV